MDTSNDNILRNQCKHLWKDVFGDSDNFIDFYFAQRFKVENTFYRLRGGRVASAMQCLPYSLTFYDNKTTVGYVSGLGTLRPFRRQGLATDLLAEAHQHLHQTGATLSLLIPARHELHDFYKSRHYGTCFYYTEEEITSSNYNSAYKTYEYTIVEQLSQETKDFIQHEMARRHCSIQHTDKDLNDIFHAMHNIFHGDIHILRSENKIRAVAVTEHIGNLLRINEVVGHGGATSVLLHHICRKSSSGDKIVLRNYRHQTQPYGMARIINLSTLTTLIAAAFPYAEHTFAVNDDDEIPENNGLYIIKGGIAEHKPTIPTGQPTLKMSELSHILLTPLHPIMSLMLD